MSTSAKDAVVPGAEEEEWPDDIVEANVGGAGGDDMYGDMLDSGWIGDLWGVGLLKETESLIAATFLRREHIERDCAWRDVLLEYIHDDVENEDEHEDGEGGKDKADARAKTMTLKDLNDLWARRNDGKAMHGNVLSAMCVRFGPPYHNLNAQLEIVNESMPVGERSRKRREIYKAFKLAHALPHLTKGSVIDMSEVVAYLTHYEMLHEIVEIQISRARTLLDEKRTEFATPEYLTDLSASLGMTGLTGKMIMPLCQSALEFAGMHRDAPCPIETLEKYCIGRASRGAGRVNQKQSHIRPMLMTLFKPKQFERDQLRAILMKNGKPAEGVPTIAELGEGSGPQLDDERHESIEATRARALQSQIKAKHIMVLVRSLPTTPSEGLISVVKLKAAMAKQYPHLSEYFIDMLCSVWFKATEALASPEIINRFFFPATGFTVRVRLPMGGGFRVSGKLAPTDGTSKIYKATIKQMFNKLKTMRAAGADSRVPGDVKLFSDEQRTSLIPDSTKACVGNEIDSGARIYASSAYVAALIEQMEEDENDAALGNSKKSSNKSGKSGKGGKGGGGSNTKPAPVTSASVAKKDVKSATVPAKPLSPRKDDPGAATAPTQKTRKSKDKPGTLQHALDRLMTISEPIVVPPLPPFPSLPSEAHTWGIPLMTKYLRDELELPVYEVAFLRSEMTGRKFVEQDEDSIRKAFKMEHSLHSKKIADHASHLRGLVFERSSIIRPSKIEDWAPEHVSGWLACKLNCSTCALASFRQCLDGHFLLSMADAAALVDCFRTVAVEDEEIGRALQGLAALVTGMCKVEPMPERPSKKKKDEAAEDAQKRLEAKRAEAELMRQQQEEENLRNFAPLLTSLKEVLARDFSMPVVPPSPREEPIKPTADKVGASVSVTVQPAIGADEGDSKGTSSRMKDKKKQKEAKSAGDINSSATESDKENSAPQANSSTGKKDADVLDTGDGDKGAKKVEESKGPQSPPEGDIPAPTSAPEPAQEPQSEAAAMKGSSDNSTVTAAPGGDANALMQASHAELERKLAKLTAMIEAQSADMRRLEETAAKLREEGAKTEERMQQEQELTRQSISQLRQDRQSSAGQALDQVVSKYTEDMESSKRALEGVIADLQQQREALLAIKEEAGASGPAPAPVIAPKTDPIVPTLDIVSTDAAVSAPTTPALKTPAPQPAVPTGVETAPAPAPVPAPAPASASAPLATAVDPEVKAPAAEDEEDVPLVTFKSMGQLMGYGSQRALQDASDLVVYGGKKPKSSDQDLGDGTGELVSPAKASQDFQALFQQVASAEVDVWKSLLKRYTHRSPSTLMVSETSSQMSRISTLWMRLGCRMLEDMRKGPNDGTTVSAAVVSKGQILAAAGVDAELEVEEEDEEGLSVTLTQDMVNGLKGLEQCARTLLGIKDPEITKRAPQQRSESSPDDGDADPYLGLQRRKLKLGSNAGLAGKEAKLSESLVRKQKREAERQLLKNAKEHSRERQGVVTDSQRKHDYDVAAGMVFCLGLAKRLLDKYPSKADHTHLLYLFTHLREGTLPLNELSRDNLRSLISNTLNITLPSWPQFDSLCQRWDPEGKGFCGVPSVVHALKNVNPLGDGLGPGDYQGIVLLTLSTVEKQLGTLCKRMDAGFLDVIFGAAARVASFDSLVGGKTQTTDAIGDDDYDDWDDWADGDEMTEEEQERRSMKMADEMQLVTDLMLESSRAFFVTDDYKSNDFVHAHQTKASTSGSGGIAATTHSFRRDRPSSSCPLCFLPPTPHTLLSACNLTARGLQIYEGRREPILEALETLATIHMLFRLMVLSRLKDDEEGIETEAAEASVASMKKDATVEDVLPRPVNVKKEKSTMRLTVPQILDQIAYVETDLKQLLGDEKAATLIKQANSGSVNLEEVERLLSELLGCPLPEHGVLGLFTSQVEVECYIYHKHQARVYKEASGAAVGHAVGTGAVAVAEKHKVHYQMALSEISATLVEELQSDGSDADSQNLNKEQKMKTTVRISSSGKPIISSKDLAQSHLLTEMAALMHRQRVDQCAVMLDHLNSKAARRKRTLEAALSLLESLKVQIPGAKVVSSVVNPRNLVVLSVEEICKRTNDLKKMVEQDMAARPTEAIKQLTKKINGFKLALRGGTIKDEDGALTMILQEIGTLEKHVVQASSDCLELISVIQMKCIDVKS